MLVPIYLGLCRAADLDKAHEAAGALINANLGMAVLVSIVHSIAMIAAGGFSAWLVYRYLGVFVLEKGVEEPAASSFFDRRENQPGYGRADHKDCRDNPDKHQGRHPWT
jgi:hypothetical protein